MNGHKRNWTHQHAQENSQHFPPDIENGIQLLRIIRAGIERHHQVSLFPWSKSYIHPYWIIKISTPSTFAFTTMLPYLSVRQEHVLLLIEQDLIQIRGMSVNEFSAQFALGTLNEKVIIEIPT